MTNTPLTTLRSLAGLSATPPPLAESAVVVIDAQREYEASGKLALADVQLAGQRIEALLTAARRVAAPIIHIAHLGQPGGLFDPATGGEFAGFATPVDGETVITKTLPNSFAGTTLHHLLETIGSPPLIIAGFMTHMCVSATARAALDLGHTTTVLSDATATRPLPAAVADGMAVSAESLHAASLAALADRFSIVCTTDVVIEPTSQI